MTKREEMEEEAVKPVVSCSLYPSYGMEFELDGEARVTPTMEGKPEIFEEARKLVWLAGPLVTVGFLQYSLQLISVIFVGHLGELALSSASMATSFAGVTGFILILGMGSALDTFCGQAFGAKQYHMLGVHMQRAMFVLLLMCTPISFIWVYTSQILMILGQDPEISTHAGIYARWLIPCISAYSLLQCQIRFLQAQNIVLPMMISAGVTTLFHVLACWILVFGYGLGNKGAALANAFSYWINVLMLAAYIKFSTSCKNTWTGFSRDALHDSLDFLKLAIPSALMISLEYWPYEILVIMSGFLPNPKLETSMMSISFDTCCLVFRIPYGLGSAVSTRVSNELGAGNPKAAYLAARVVLFLTIAVGTLVAFTFYLARGVWGYLYTNEEELVRYLEAIMPILVISNFMDGIQAVLSGVARGCGWQNIGAYVNLGAYYFVGLPSAIFLTFVVHLRGKGFWLGITCGSSLQAFLLLLVTMRTNWEQQANKARARVLNDSIPAMSTSDMHALSELHPLPQKTSDLKYHILPQQYSDTF